MHQQKVQVEGQFIQLVEMLKIRRTDATDRITLPAIAVA